MLRRRRGGIAQRLEQGAHNALVGGSNPSAPTTLRPDGATRGTAMRSNIDLGEAVSCVARRAKHGRRRIGAITMWYVYIIKSVSHPDQEYTGASEDLKQRVADHNAGKSTHTAKFAPWELVWYCAFPDKYKALEFEKYLKSHSGRAFAKKRL